MPERTAMLASAIFTTALVFALFAQSSRGLRAEEECISKPNAPAPQGQHWYYRTDRESKRQCWYLGPEGATVRKRAAETLNAFKPDTPATPAALPRDAANLSQQQREALFQKFIEWRRSHPAQ